MWTDIASIVFASVTINHLGLVGAVERVIGRAIPVVDCPRCLSFWGVLAYLLASSAAGGASWLSGDGTAAAIPSALARVLAISLCCSYAATWLELAEGIIDRLYDYIYGKVYTAADTADDDAQRP